MVFTVAASDVDSGVSGAVLYGLVVDSPAFQLAAGGVLTIAGELDYEAQQTYQVTPLWETGSNAEMLVIPSPLVLCYICDGCSCTSMPTTRGFPSPSPLRLRSCVSLWRTSMTEPLPSPLTM